MTEKSIHPDLFEARKIAALTHSGKYEIDFLEGYLDDGDLVRSIIAGIKLGRELGSYDDSDLLVKFVMANIKHDREPAQEGEQ